MKNPIRCSLQNGKKKFIVGIPAYNEEKSIKNMLSAIFQQSIAGYTFTGIVVYSDGSNDNTCEIVSEYKKQKVTLIHSSKRSGKTTGIKELLKASRKAGVDFLIIIDSDLSLKSKFVLNNLLRRIDSNLDNCAVSGFVLPCKPKNLVERIGYFGFYLWDIIILNSKEKEDFFRSSDPLIVLRVNEFSENRIRKYSYMHDEFYFLFSQKYQKQFVFERDANAYFRLPATLRDYIIQIRRYISSHISKNERLYLGNKNYTIPVWAKFYALIKCMKQDLFVSLCYFAITIYIHISNVFKPKKFQNIWTQVKSTK